MTWGNTLLCQDFSKVPFTKDPPQPHYTQTWDVGMVTAYLGASGDNKLLSLQDLSHKLAMLMALTRPPRSADLAKLDLQVQILFGRWSNLQTNCFVKTVKTAKAWNRIFFPCFHYRRIAVPDDGTQGI